MKCPMSVWLLHSVVVCPLLAALPHSAALPAEINISTVSERIATLTHPFSLPAQFIEPKLFPRNQSFL